MGLEVIRPGVQFRPDAAASFRRTEADQGRRLGVNRTVVPRAEQAALYARRLRGEYPYPVAHPDYSNHVYESDERRGNAWDTDERGDWLDEHGWIADVPDEPWHREYRPHLDRHRNRPAGNSTGTTGDTPVAMTPEEIIMSAVPFIATVEKRDQGGNGPNKTGEKQFLIQPNPNAGPGSKEDRFLVLGWSGGDSKSLVHMDARQDWVYSRLKNVAPGVNRS